MHYNRYLISMKEKLWELHNFQTCLMRFDVLFLLHPFILSANGDYAIRVDVKASKGKAINHSSFMETTLYASY